MTLAGFKMAEVSESGKESNSFESLPSESFTDPSGLLKFLFL